MSVENWRVEYLSDELREYKKLLEDAEKMMKQAQSEMYAAEWLRNKYRAIVEMLEVAYKVNIHSNPKAEEQKQP
jgi:hypothetical protein